MARQWQAGEDEGPLGRQWDELLAFYREACGEPEGGADFMPRLWDRIEARRGVTTLFGRLTQRFVTAAAAICLVMTIYLLYPHSQASPFYAANYVEVLADANEPEHFVYTETVLLEAGLENGRR